MATYEPRYMSGSCRTATDTTGRFAHAVDVNGWGWEKALCGKTPGRKGNGWSDYKPAAVTCPKCLAKLAQFGASSLAQWYMDKAQTWAEEAEARRDAWCDMQAIRWAQDKSAVYATLAQEAAARYGEAR